MDHLDGTLRAAVEQAADVFLLTDLAGVIRYANAAVQRVSGYAPGEILGRHVRLLKSGRHDPAFYRTLWTTLCQGQVWAGTFVNRRKDGRLYEDHTTISPVRNDEGSVVGYLAVKRDVTDERRAKLQRRQAQTLDAIGRVAGGVAHDFNNALMTIMGYAEMLEHRLAPTGGSPEAIVEIKAACDRAASLTRQLLAFGRRKVRDLTVLDANRAVLGLEKMLRRLLGEEIRVSLAASPRTALVRFEVGQIEQIIMALAARAREAMPSGGTLTVTVCDAESGASDSRSTAFPPGLDGEIAVRVADTGVTLDEDALERIFEPFSSSVLQPWGSGLSLATAYAMVTQCGGRIFAQGAPGGGTVFTICLPRAFSDPETTAPDLRPSRSRSGTETVLLAEDEAGVRAAVRDGLTRLGYRVIDAPDGATALLRAAETGKIDLLITDVAMPGMSARELTERLLVSHPGLKVIYMSGHTDAAIGDPETWGGGAVFLRKPFTAEALARRVRELFG